MSCHGKRFDLRPPVIMLLYMPNASFLHHFSSFVPPHLQILKEQGILSLIRLPAPHTFSYYLFSGSPHSNFTNSSSGIRRII